MLAGQYANSLAWLDDSVHRALDAEGIRTVKITPPLPRNRLQRRWDLFVMRRAEVSGIRIMHSQLAMAMCAPHLFYHLERRERLECALRVRREATYLHPSLKRFVDIEECCDLVLLEGE